MRYAFLRTAGGPFAAPLRGALSLVCLGLVAVGCGGSDVAGGDRSSRATVTDPTAVVRAVTTPRQPPPRIDVSPGAVRLEAGPFTDRVTIEGLSLDAGQRPVVRGRLRNTVDVSELIVLELQADFYDGSGRLLGSGRQVFRDVHAGADGDFLRFAIRSSAAQPAARAAVLSIPQLVNE